MFDKSEEGRMALGNVIDIYAAIIVSLHGYIIGESIYLISVFV